MTTSTAKERLYLYDTTLRARSRAGLKAEHEQNPNGRRAAASHVR